MTNLLLLVVLGNSIVDILSLSPLGDKLVSFWRLSVTKLASFWGLLVAKLAVLVAAWRQICYLLGVFAAFTPYELGCILVSGTIFDFSEHDNNNSAIGTEIPHYRVTKLAL